MYKKLKQLFSLMCCIGSCSITAQTTHHLPKQAKVPGGIAIVHLDISSDQPPLVHYQQIRALVIQDSKYNNKWISIIGIPLDAKPGIHTIQITKTNGEQTSKSFEIKNKTYRNEKLTIPDKRKVKPLEEDLPIIEQQYIETVESYAHWQYRPLNSVVLGLPVKGRKSSPFGLTRIMNNIPQNPHSGLDIAAPKGTPVRAPKDGTIINIGNYFYSGNIVFIDHGQGFITSYGHLDTVKVTKDQHVAQGQVIGTIGNTGRATGAHLHWSVSLNGVRVDPEWFVYE